jgi:hypothetical protein
MADDLAVRLDGELREYVTLRRRAELAEEEAKGYRKQADEQRDRLWEIMEAAGVKTINHELGRMTRTAQNRAIVTDDDSLSHFLSEQGIYDAMTRRAWRQANLNELVNEMIEGGDPLPAGLDSLTIKGIRYTPKKS